MSNMRNSDSPEKQHRSMQGHRYSNLTNPAREYEEEEMRETREGTGCTKWKSRSGNTGEGKENKQQGRTRQRSKNAPESQAGEMEDEEPVSIQTVVLVSTALSVDAAYF
jgi:hypothetical protein